MSEDREPRRIDRRTIAKGAAWAVPAVPLIVATPAYATSGPPPTLQIGDFCKLPGNACGNIFRKGYVAQVTVTNSTDLPIYLYNEPGFEFILTEDNDDLDLGFDAAIYGSGPNEGTEVAFPILLDPGESVILFINAQDNESSNEEVNLTITIPWGHTEDPNDDDETVNGEHEPITDTKNFPDAPPVNGAQCEFDLPC